MKQRLVLLIKGKEKIPFVVVSDITELCFAFFFFNLLFLGKLACEGICVERISVTGFSSCHTVLLLYIFSVKFMRQIC